MLFSETLRTLNTISSADLLINSRYDIVTNFNALNTYSQVHTAGIIQLAYQADLITGDGQGAITPENLKTATLQWPISQDVDLYASGVLLGAEAVSAYVPNIQYITDYNDNVLDAQYLRRNASDTPNADNVYDLGTAGAKWANIYATNFNGTATNALYADIAEIYTCEEELTIGTLVSVSDEGDYEVQATDEELDIKCIGVVSEKPALLMNSEGNGVTVALVGKVPVKVIGRVKKGDVIVSSSAKGVGRAAANSNEYVFGFARALESKDNPQHGKVNCIIKR